MDKFLTSAGDNFEWKQPKTLDRSFELFRQSELFGTLKFHSYWGSLAWSEDPIQAWSFKRIGFLNPHVTIRMPDADSDYALFIPKLFTGGTLHPPDGRLIYWQPLNFWYTKWLFTDTRGSPVLSLIQQYQPADEPKLSDLIKIQADMAVERNHITNLEFSMLVNLGFYLLVMQAMDNAAISASSA